MYGFERDVVDRVRDDVGSVAMNHALHARIPIIKRAVDISFRKPLWRIGVHWRCVCDVVFDEVTIEGDERWGDVPAHETIELWVNFPRFYRARIAGHAIKTVVGTYNVELLSGLRAETWPYASSTL